MSTKSAPQKACCSCCPPDKLLPWLLSILFTILITASAIYAYQAYFSRKPQIWVEPPFTLPPTETPVSSTDTSTWQTYKNDQYGFEIKYPDSWRIISDPMPRYTSGINFVDNDNCIWEYCVISNISETTLNKNQFLDKYWNNVIATNNTKTKPKEFKIRGFEATQITEIDTTNLNTEYTFIQTPKGNFIFSTDTGNDLNNQTAYQVLSTFKFLDSTSSTSTSTWQTYKNEKYGFEFRYPKEFLVNGLSSGNFPIFRFESVKYGSFSIVPKGENDWGPSGNRLPDQRTIIGGREATVELYDSNEKIIRFSDYPQSWNSSNRIDVQTNVDSIKLIDQILSTFKFIDTTTKTTKEITENWNTIKFSWYGLTCKIPEGWGIINDALNGRFIPVYSDKTFTEGFSPIQIQKNQTSKNNLTLALNEGAKGSKNFYEISGSEPEFDYIISTCEFSQVNH